MSYFRIIKPLPNIYHIEDARGVYSTLLTGSKGALLADTGTGIGNIAKEVRNITELPLTVINTHGHSDHTFGNYQFPKVYMAETEWETAKKCGSDEVKQRILSLSEVVPEDFDAEAYFNYRFDNLVPLKADLVFDLGGLTVKPIPMPSHSPGSMGLFCPELELLLTGDSAAPMVFLVLPESSDIKTHVKVLNEVRKLPFQWILSSHSERLIPKEEIELYVKCAGSVDRKKTVRYKSQFFPEFPGRMFVYDAPDNNGEIAIIVFNESKLEDQVCCKNLRNISRSSLLQNFKQ